MFNGRTNKSNARFTCPNCCIVSPSSEESRDKAKKVVKGADDLPRSKMSDEIEKGLLDALHTAYTTRSMELGVSYDDIEKANGLCVRVLSNVEKKNLVGERMVQRYKFKGYPNAFPLRSKCIALFQKIHGVDTLLFAMYVYEYGDDCPAPNRRHVYISYLDSVRYFEPKCYRTTAYHAIIVEYLRYVKKRGFHTASIWSCPPVNGDDYIFYCHPKHQLVPKEDMLRAWYHKMLDQAKAQGIVLSTSTLYDEFFSSDSESNTGQLLTPTCLPYFEGDYIPGELEIIIQQCEANGDHISDLSSHDTVMVRLGHNLLKMKDNFIVVHLRNKRFVDAVKRGEDVSQWKEDSDDDMVRCKRAKISAKLSPETDLGKVHVATIAKSLMNSENYSSSTEYCSIEANATTSTDALDISTDSAKAAHDSTTLNEETASVVDRGESKTENVFVPQRDNAPMNIDEAKKASMPAREVVSPPDTQTGGVAATVSDEVAVDVNAAMPNVEVEGCSHVEEQSHGAVRESDHESVIGQTSATAGKSFQDLSDPTNNLEAVSDSLNLNPVLSCKNESQVDVGKVSTDEVVEAVETVTAVPVNQELQNVVNFAAIDCSSSESPTEAICITTEKSIESVTEVAETSQIASSQDASKLENEKTTVTNLSDDVEPARKRALDDVALAVENHFNGLTNSKQIVSDTSDDDPPMESEMFESRQQFLNYCQSAHCQFDELRRAKHSTVMVLFQLHNPSAPRFLQQCGACYRDITHGMRYHCNECSNFDLCEDCYEPIIAGTLAKRDPRFAHDTRHTFTAVDMESTDDTPKSQADRQNSLKAHVELLEHAAFCGGPPTCSLHNCDRFKKIFLHCSTCEIKPKRDCKICTRLLVLCTMHSRLCNSIDPCPVPFCDRIRERNKRLCRQQQLMDDRRRQAQNELYHAGGEN